MCYPCTNCGACHKQEEGSVFYVPPATIPCLKCGGDVDPKTGVCTECGYVAFEVAGGRRQRWFAYGNYCVRLIAAYLVQKRPLEFVCFLKLYCITESSLKGENGTAQRAATSVGGISCNIVCPLLSLAPVFSIYSIT